MTRVVLARRDHGSPDPGRLPTDAELDEASALGSRPYARDLAPVGVTRDPSLDARAGGARVWIADETKQVTGSFKVRGALFALSRLAARGAREVVVVSAGNHGAGVAFAARALGVRATVYVPETAPEKKRDRIRSHGAEIVVVPTKSYDEAESVALAAARERGAPFLSPYDDHDVVLGNGASLGFEIARALGGAPAALVAPFGGGGLATGLAWALRRVAGDGPSAARRVWGAQSEASPAMAESLARGEAFTSWASAETVAEGLEGGVSAPAFERARAAVAGVVVVSEEAIVRAMRHAVRELGVVAEGSAAAALAPLLEGLPPEITRSAPADVVVVLTGGNVDPARLAALG